MAYVDGMNDDVVWCIESMTDPSVCVIAHRAMSCRPRHSVVAINHDDVMTCDSPGLQRDQGSATTLVVTMCVTTISMTTSTHNVTKAPPRPPASGSGGQSDTLETRTKLTSHSALECGGLPQLPPLITTSKGIETPAGLNSRLEAVSGA